MNDDARPALAGVYAAADYRVRLAAVEMVIHVDRPDAAIDRLLRTEAGVGHCWAIVTPCNPGSRPLDEVVNAGRIDELAAALAAAGLTTLPAVNRDPSGSWPDEPGFLVVDPPPGDVEALARRFGQHAIVTGVLGEAPRLIWL